VHIARIETRSLDETAEAVDLGQSPAEVVLLSFTDSDLAAFAAAWDRMSEPRPSLRLANLAALKHPYSVDLYLETVCSRARFILVRLLGGIEYWRYGVEQLAALAKARGIALALMSGDRFEDARLVKASRLDGASLRLLGSYFEDGGPDNMAACLAFITRGKAPAPRAVAAFGLYEPPHPRPLPARTGWGVATVPLPASCGEGLGVGRPLAVNDGERSPHIASIRARWPAAAARRRSQVRRGASSACASATYTAS
jgi:cobaltochelatase CobN